MKSNIAALFLLPFSLNLFAQQYGPFDLKMDVTTICPDCPVEMGKLETDLILQLDKGADPQQVIGEVEAQIGVKLMVSRPLAPRFGIYGFAVMDGGKDFPNLEDLESLSAVLSAERNAPVEFRDTMPNDPHWSDNWSFAHIGLPKIWNISTGGHTAKGDEIVVAILDSGFDLSHEDLQGNLWENQPEVDGLAGVDDDGNGLVDDFHGWNFQRDTNDLYPLLSNGHGTSVAGIIGGKGNNGIGVTGVNWDVKMMFFTVKEKDEVIAAFNYIIEQRELYQNTNGEKGAFVVATNTSFGIDGSPCDNHPSWAAMYDLLGQAGVLNMAATANENWNVDEVGDMPTSCPSDFLVTVTATNQEDERMYNAAFGPASIDLAAPGDTIVTVTLNQGYLRGFGSTSAATPHVTGTVALLYSLPCADLVDLAMDNPPAAALLMKNALLQNVEPASTLRGKTVTGGRLNGYESFKHIHSWCIGLEEDRMADHVKEVYQGRRAVVHIYPNPARERVTVRFAALDFGVPVRFRVFNALGQEMYLPENGISEPFEGQAFEMDVSDWPNGMYLVNIIDNSLKIAMPFWKL